MKLLYASDLHGEIHLYQELFALATSSSAEIIALGWRSSSFLPPDEKIRRYGSKPEDIHRPVLAPFLEEDDRNDQTDSDFSHPR